MNGVPSFGMSTENSIKTHLGEVMLIVENTLRIILTYAVPQEESVNSDYYYRFLHHLRPIMRLNITFVARQSYYRVEWQHSLSCRTQCNQCITRVALGGFGTPSVLNWHESLWLRPLSFSHNWIKGKISLQL